MRKLFVTTLLIVAGPSAIAAQLSIPRVDVGLLGQYTRIDDKLKVDNPPAVGALVAFPVYKWLGIEGSAALGPSKAQIAPFGKMKYAPLRGIFTLSVPVAAKTAVVLGGGWAYSIYDGHRTGNEIEHHGTGQAGIKVCGDGKWGARADALGDYTALPDDWYVEPLYGETWNWTGRVGVTYALRGSCAASSKAFDWKMAAAGAATPLPRGSSRQLALSAADDDARPIEVRKVANLVCSSTNPNVATVDNSGNVRAVSYGTSTVTCKGVVKKIERSATYDVNVPPPAWTITVPPTTQSRDVGQTVSTAATARDVDNVDLGAASWSSSNTSVATVSNTGVITCQGGGTAVITATKTAYGTSKSASTNVTCNAPPPPPPAAPRMIRLDSTQFVFNQAALKQSGTAMLQTVVDAMKSDPTIRVSVEGHTDWYGTDEYNESLATSRATRIANELRKLGGESISADRIVMRGYGERCLLVRDGDPEPRGRLSEANKAAQAPNRRVEIWQLLPSETDAPMECRSEAQRSGRVPFVPGR